MCTVDRSSDQRNLRFVRSECQSLGFRVGDNVGFNPHERLVAGGGNI